MSFWNQNKTKSSGKPADSGSFWGKTTTATTAAEKAKEKTSPFFSFKGLKKKDDKKKQVVRDLVSNTPTRLAKNPDGTYKAKVGFWEVAANLPEGALKTGKEIVQATTRTAASVGITAGNLPRRASNIITGKKDLPFPAEVDMSKSKAGKLVFGDRSVKDIPGAGARTIEDINQIRSGIAGREVSPINKNLAIPVGIIGSVIDLSGWGGKKGIKSFAEGEIPQKFLRFLAKERSPEAIESTLRGIGLDDEKAAKNLAARLAPTKSVDEVKQVLVGSEGPRQPGFWDSEPRRLTEARQVLADAEQKAKTRNTSKSTERPLETPPGDTEATPQIPIPVSAREIPATIKQDQPTKSGLDLLEEEARKYKSAEEFVKAKTNAYHGTPGKEFDEFKLGVGRNTENETNGLGVWVTPQTEAAKVFSNKIEQGLFSGSSLKDVGGSVMPVSTQLKNPKVYTATKGMGSILDEISALENERPSLSIASFESDPTRRRELFDKRDEINKKIEQLRRQYQRDAFEVFMDDRDQFAEYIQKGAKWEDRYVANNIPETNKKFIEYLRAQGHDGIIIKSTAYDAKSAGLDSIDQIVVFDPKQVLTRKQLTDIYNKAVGKVVSQVKPVKKAESIFPDEAPFKGDGSDFKKPIPIKEPVQRAMAQIKKKTPEAVKERSIPVSKIELPDDIQKQKDLIEITESSLADDRAAGLEKYIVQSGDFEGQLPEVTGGPLPSYLKKVKSKNVLRFAKEGDSIVTEHGFKDLEEARAGLELYMKRKEELKQLKKDFYNKKKEYILEVRDRAALDAIGARGDKLKLIQEATGILRAEGKSRAAKVKAIGDHFGLSEKEMDSIIKKREYTTLSDAQFDELLKRIESKAYDMAELRDARIQVLAQIEGKDLRNVENLMLAMKLPGDISKLTMAQLQQLDEALRPFMHGDTFLGRRQLETLKYTDLDGIKTRREALDALIQEIKEKTGQDVKLEELFNINIGATVRGLYDTALARQNPFFRILVDENNYATIAGNLRFKAIEIKLNKLISEARKSRPRKLVDRIAPTDDRIFAWLEAAPEDKITLARNMTRQELAAAKYVRKLYSDARDYLIVNEKMDGYRKDYITHSRRGFLEAVLKPTKDLVPKVDGSVHVQKTHFWSRLKAGVKELFDVYKDEKSVFTILNDKTGEILPLEKFFKFTLRRSGEIQPTKNVSQAVLTYFRAFEKMRMFDSFMSKLDVYAHVLTPQAKTKRGLIKDDSLHRFVKEWINTKKGRPIDTKFATPGGKVDWTLRAGVAMTRIWDLGWNIPTGVAAQFGPMFVNTIALGPKKYIKGSIRSFTKQGKMIAKKYEHIVGKTFIERMRDTSIGLGDKALSTSLALFAAAERRARVQYLLANLTPEEFKSGKVTVDRLTDIYREMGRYISMNGDESVFGKTAPGKVFTQYKSWAVPLLTTTQSNVKKVIKMLKQKKSPVNTREFQELFRGILVTATTAYISASVYLTLKDKRERTFVENLVYKSINDMLSLVGALDPSLWSSARLLTFFNDMAESTSTIIRGIATGDRTEDGEVPGVSRMKKLVTPRVIKDISGPSDEEKTKDAMEDLVYHVQELKAEGREEEIEQIIAKQFPETPEGDANYEKYKSTKSRVLREQMTDTYHRVHDLLEKGKEGEARQIVNELTDDQYEAYNRIRIKNLVPEVRELAKKGKEEEARAIVDGLSDDEYKIYQDAARALDKAEMPVFDPGKEVDERTLIGKVFTYAHAIGVDPITAFNRIFTNQSIRRVDSGAVIINRNTTTFGKVGQSGFSTRVREDRGATGEQRLDHTIPIQLGGADSEDNVKVISVEEWERNTPVENYLGKALREKRVKKKEAQKLIVQFKDSEITFEEIKQQVP